MAAASPGDSWAEVNLPDAHIVLVMREWLVSLVMSQPILVATRTSDSAARTGHVAKHLPSFYAYHDVSLRPNAYMLTK